MTRLLPIFGATLFAAPLMISTVTAAPSERSVLSHYADLAQWVYSDAHDTAVSLQQTIDALIANPEDATLNAARRAWVTARHPYQQTEAFRFGNAIVDDWEGKVNAWPLDEGLIDYVDSSYGDVSDENLLYTANVIANPRFDLSGVKVDASTIDKALLADTLHEVDEVESNVATGYHAIEFLLWGQDLNGTGPGAGNRPATDFDTANCTGGNCDRRAAYLATATALLVDELAWMRDQWAENGEARTTITSGDLRQNIATIFTGMGSLSYGELAGERMKLGLMLHDPEEEHDCFSDNTHWSHYNDALGIRNVYTGSYTTVDGKLINGPALADLVKAQDAGTDTALRAKLDDTLAKMQAIVDRAAAGEAYDQQIGEGNSAGNATVLAAVNALVAQTKSIEKAVSVMGMDNIVFEGSDSLDNPSAVE